MRRILAAVLVGLLFSAAPPVRQKRPLGEARPPHLPINPVASTHDTIIRWRSVGLDFLSLLLGVAKRSKEARENDGLAV